ncbi:SGNH/GDSL hydrolase family protein [Cohnella candidum]|uniref:SGNH/GDSL hydrolase family protein n=1 Tax=Cohnella candidum TaxID=2674991 RepID=A0A3G3JWP3_9BACL|nr:SGNH/GDSL hydrolase family protein [Cohnella candidum]AYQ72271.1 SGNH/GDSL hydrolase family protein [Cohnella candidum]
MKRVLLLGDSIRLGYEPFVREGLAGLAEVVAPEENGRFAKHTLWGVNLWLRDLGKPDVVHWNNGLWDLHHEPPMVEALTSLPEYLETLRRILNELQRTGAAVIFATTTPIAPDGAGRSNAEIDTYNEAAVLLMRSSGVEVNDLNALVKADLNGFLCEDKLHLTEQGSRRCAAQVVEKIKAYL